jgi:hypothetical protein
MFVHAMIFRRENQRVGARHDMFGCTSRKCGEAEIFRQESALGGVRGGLWFGDFFFHALSCRKFPVSVGLGARSASVQLTNFTDGSATGGAGHRQYLFRGQIFSLHISHLASVDSGKNAQYCSL